MSASISFREDDSIPDYSAVVSEPDEIGKRVRQVRESRGNLSQSEFASRLTKVSRGAVGNWELGKGIKRENIQAIADKFGVSFEWLASGRGTMETTGPTSDPYQNAPNAIVGDKLPQQVEYLPLYGHAVGGRRWRVCLERECFRSNFGTARVVANSWRICGHMPGR